jgi:4-amino-4-deoxychorismate lyase
MSAWFKGGRRIDSVSIDNRAFSYGDGVFETVAIRKGQARLWNSHLERLFDSCKRLGIVAPSADALADDLSNALRASNTHSQNAVAKIIVSANIAERGYGRPENTPGETHIGIFDSRSRPVADYQDGVATRRCTINIATQPALAGIKSLNRLEQVIARNEWRDPEIAEGLMCDTEGHLICGTMSNVFVAKNNSIITPALHRCGVAGVMRRHVIELLSRNNLRVLETDLKWESAMSADELFLTNSQFGLLPIRVCDQFEWPVGPLTRKTMKLLADNGIEECAT